MHRSPKVWNPRAGFPAHKHIPYHGKTCVPTASPRSCKLKDLSSTSHTHYHKHNHNTNITWEIKSFVGKGMSAVTWEMLTASCFYQDNPMKSTGAAESQPGWTRFISYTAGLHRQKPFYFKDISPREKLPAIPERDPPKHSNNFTSNHNVQIEEYFTPYLLRRQRRSSYLCSPVAAPSLSCPFSRSSCRWAPAWSSCLSPGLLLAHGVGA